MNKTEKKTMRIKYSQKWAKEKVDEKIKRLCAFVPGIKTADLLIKVFCYTKIRSYTDNDGIVHEFGSQKYRGHYRHISYHGFYDNEWDYFDTLKRIPTHHITLKFHPGITDERLLHFIAHEYGHLKDWRKYNGERYKCAQKKCDKFADKCVERFKKSAQQNNY